MKYHPASNTWACGFGGRLNHKIVKVESTHGNMGTYRAHFACGSHSDYIPDGYAHGKPRCKKCEAAEHSAHPTLLDSAPLEALSTPEHLATSQTDQTPQQRG